MSKTTIEKHIESMGRALRENREKVAAAVLADTELFEDLLELTFNTTYKLHYKAAWTLEIVLENDLSLILPKIDYFTANIHLLKHESALRPIAKICKWIAIAYVIQKDSNFIKALSNENILQLIETGFDWMIMDTNVATEAYTMEALYHLGLLDIHEVNWVHPELKNILLQNMPSKSAAYKARGRMVLERFE